MSHTHRLLDAFESMTICLPGNQGCSFTQDDGVAQYPQPEACSSQAEGAVKPFQGHPRSAVLLSILRPKLVFYSWPAELS